MSDDRGGDKRAKFVEKTLALKASVDLYTHYCLHSEGKQSI
jgi:hypothetical protein